MGLVSRINYISGTDRTFTLMAKFQESQEPKNLSAFVGQSGDALSLYLPGDHEDAVILTLDDSVNGKIEVVDNSAGLAGKIKVIFKDTIQLRERDGQDMELRIREGAGPDFDVSCIQYQGTLTVKKKLFQ